MQKMNTRYILYLFSLMTIIILASCSAVEGFEPSIVLNNPVIQVISVTNYSGTDWGIFIQFMALNDTKEPYFSGYNVYMQTNLEALSLDVISNIGLVPSKDGFATPPTITASPSDSVYTYTIIVTNDYSTNVNGKTPLALSETYYFYVTAYSTIYNKNSRGSNVTNVLFIH